MSKPSPIRGYFARPISFYGTGRDHYDILCLESHHVDIVIDPSARDHQEAYKRDGFDHFLKLVDCADELYFRAFDDGKIGSGVAREILHAEERGYQIRELSGDPVDTLTRIERGDWKHRVLSIDETRARVYGFPDLRSAVLARRAEWETGEKITLSFRGLELAGEAGEACNVMKKIERERLGMRGSRATLDDLAEELADVAICMEQICIDTSIDLQKAIARKFNKTSAANGLRTRMREG